MTTIDSNELNRVCGGYEVVQRRSTPGQIATYNRCVARADGISAAKPWTWGRKSATRCFGDLLHSIENNPGTTVEM